MQITAAMDFPPEVGMRNTVLLALLLLPVMARASMRLGIIRAALARYERERKQAARETHKQ